MARPEDGEPAPPRGLVRIFRGIGGALLRIPRPLATAGALGWALVIWFLSSQPGRPFGPQGPFAEVLGNLAHAPEYGILALWLVLALPRRSAWPVLDTRALVGILLVVLLYAVLDEFHQSFTPHRDASAFDVLTDFIGACATLSCVVAGGGPRANSRELLLRLVLGFFACVLAASLATFAPESFPGATWL